MKRSEGKFVNSGFGRGMLGVFPLGYPCRSNAYAFPRYLHSHCYFPQFPHPSSFSVAVIWLSSLPFQPSFSTHLTVFLYPPSPTPATPSPVSRSPDHLLLSPPWSTTILSPLPRFPALAREFRGSWEWISFDRH